MEPTAISFKNTQSLEFQAIANDPVMDGVKAEDRNKVMSYALGLSIARHLPLPSMPVASIYSYYRGNNEEHVRNASNTFNERIVIDYQLVKEFALKFWCTRYFALHNSENLPTFSQYGFFESVMGANQYFDEKTILELNEIKAAIISISNKINAFLYTVEENKAE